VRRALRSLRVRDLDGLPPHLPLLGPFEAQPSLLPLEQHCWEVCHRAAPFEISFGAPTIDLETRVVSAPLVHGTGQLAELREALLTGKYAPPRTSATTAEPRALFFQVEAEDVPWAQERLAEIALDAPATVEQVDLMAQYPDGTWYRREFWTLDGVVTHR
jgi:hypothetical protein